MAGGDGHRHKVAVIVVGSPVSMGPKNRPFFPLSCGPAVEWVMRACRSIAVPSRFRLAFRS